MPREDLPGIRTRRDLFDYLEQQMNRSYRQLLDTGIRHPSVFVLAV